MDLQIAPAPFPALALCSWWAALQARLDLMVPLWERQTGGWRGHALTPTGRFAGHALSGEIYHDDEHGQGAGTGS